MIEPVFFNKKEFCLEIIDQTLLPLEEKIMSLYDEHQTVSAIKAMRVRGAPAIGIAAAYGIALGLANKQNHSKPFSKAFNAVCKLIESARPTAVNLSWAVKRIKKLVKDAGYTSFSEAAEAVAQEADKIKAEDIEMCRKIGKYGAEFIKDGGVYLTHCNAGALATGGFGTALGVFRAAKAEGKKFTVFIDETRPLLQGARLTAWELIKEGIDSVLICDGAAGSLIRSDKINAVIVGADRITANGFAANKIGTYPLAVLAKYNGLKFFVAAPASSFDLTIKYDDEITIEQRDPDEVRFIKGCQIAPKNIKVFNPAFDITPPELITAFFTDRGVINPIYSQTIPEYIKKAENE